ncbi:hypothetical protein C8J56DRAFT_949577 [Mycena floridula]|nr:hypothetical protein C8J56DRAFT_949577 [Mycena floridula]
MAPETAAKDTSSAVQFAHLFTTNESPSNDERQLIQRYLAGKETEISHLDDEKTKSIALDELAAYRALLSPLRRLPSEIIAEIFLHCLPRRPKATQRSSSMSLSFSQPQEAPMLLCTISQHWRDIALSTPALWIHLRYRDDTDRDDYDLWLSRSGILPLNISIVTGNDYQSLCSTARVLNILVPHLGRWKSVEWVMEDRRVAIGADMGRHPGRMRVIEESFSDPHEPPVLESLTVHVPNDDDLPAWAPTLIGPSLRELDWQAPTTKLLERNTVNLRSLTLAWNRSDSPRNVPSLDILLILQNSPVLENCDVSLTDQFFSAATPESPSPSIIRHLSLRQFTIRPASISTIGLLLDSIELPALDEIFIDSDPTPFHDENDDGSWIPETLLPLLSRSRCSLTTLSIKGLRCSKATWIQLFEHPSVNLTLTTLNHHCYFPSVWEHLLQRLTKESDCEEMIPQLSALSLTIARTDIHLLKIMLESRRIPIQLHLRIVDHGPGHGVSFTRIEQSDLVKILNGAVV